MGLSHLPLGVPVLKSGWDRPSKTVLYLNRQTIQLLGLPYRQTHIFGLVCLCETEPHRSPEQIKYDPYRSQHYYLDRILYPVGEQ